MAKSESKKAGPVDERLVAEADPDGSLAPDGGLAANLPADLPRNAILRLTDLLLGSAGGAPRPATLRLRFRSGEPAVRDLGAYLALLDHIYGRLRPGGLRSYAQVAAEQLRVVGMGANGGELAIEERVDRTRPWRLAILWLCLRMLPAVVDGLSKRSWAEAFRGFREPTSSDAGVQPGLFPPEDFTLRRRLEQDPALAGLGPRDIEALVTLLERLYAAEAELVPAALRFAQDAVEDVELG